MAIEIPLILLLGSVLISVSLPFYASIAATPEEVFFGEGVFVISQASRGAPLTYELVEMLRSQEWTEAVSPEVYAFVSLGGQAITVRGVEARALAELEGIELPEGVQNEFLLVGHRLASRLGLGEGDVLLLPGSTRPMLMEARVDGVLAQEGALGDEIVLDLPRARRIAGLGESAIILIRVRVDDGSRLLHYLASQREEVVVGKVGQGLRVEDGRLVDDRIGAILLTRPELAREVGRSYMASFARYSANSLRVLTLGMGLLTGALFIIVLASSVVRSMVERRRDLGLVMALGGGIAALMRAFGSRFAALGLLAGGVGVGVGILIGEVLEAWGAFYLFGHALSYRVSPSSAAWIFALYAASFLGCLMLGLLFLRAQEPRDLLYEPPQEAAMELEVGRG